jgi:hypothetical protein
MYRGLKFQTPKYVKIESQAMKIMATIMLAKKNDFQVL